MIAPRLSSMKSLVLLLLPLTALLFLVSYSTGSRLSAAPQTQTIVIRDSKFQPATLTVNVGDTVECKNSDIVPHTATSTESSEFDSGRIAP